MREIRVILEKGRWKLETSGYQGEACLQDTERLLAFLRAQGIELDSLDIKEKPEIAEVAERAVTRHKLSTG